MKAIKRILCIALVAMMLCAAALPACAATKTVYLNDNDGGSSYVYFDLGEFKKGTKITDVKSSKKSVVIPSWLSYSDHKYTNYENKKLSKNYVRADLEARALKAGSAKITYKAGSTAKSLAVKVLKYVNPVKSFVITGLGNTNLKSKFANGGNFYAAPLTKDVGAGYLKASAASGWKISNAYFTDRSDWSSYDFWAYSKPVSSIKLHVPAMKTGGEGYYARVTFVNTKNKGEIEIYYSIPGYDDEY